MTAEAKRPFPDLPETIKTIHIIGVCGTAMGSLAAMLIEKGYTVRGSDAMAYPPMSDWLRERGVEIMLGYDESNLDWEPDLVIVGNVVRATYGDAVAARERGFAQLSLPEALRHFFMDDKRRLVITGTHGKTTTSSMLAWICFEAGLDPGFMIGGITGNFDSNYRLGQGELFVIEGDEYDTAYFDKVPKFWHYGPTRATINNIEFDHADIYPDIESIEGVFTRLVALLPADGSLWVNGDDARAMRISEDAPCPRHTFGLGEDNDLRATNIEQGLLCSFQVHHNGEDLGTFETQTVGDFNVRNALGALALALEEGVDLETARAALATFVPVMKRQQLIGKTDDDILIFDDFAHHPTAVGVTVAAMRERFPERRLWAIFEAKSNTSRRRVFQDAYAPALGEADIVILSKPWRKDESLPEDELLDIEQLAETIAARGPRTELIAEIDAIVDLVRAEAQPGDVILGLSGSSFGGLHHKLLEALNDRS